VASDISHLSLQDSFFLTVELGGSLLENGAESYGSGNSGSRVAQQRLLPPQWTERLTEAKMPTRSPSAYITCSLSF